MFSNLFEVAGFATAVGAAYLIWGVPGGAVVLAVVLLLYGWRLS